MASPAREIHLLGVASNLGAPGTDTATAPAALHAWGLETHLRHAGLDVRWADTLHAGEPPAGIDLDHRIVHLGAFARRLAARVEALCASGALPLILGGDHSIAAGTWRGVACSLQPRGKLGLIWIDAHLDSHTQDTTHSGNIHGMPLAALLGEGNPELAAIDGPELDPRQVCVVGARSWEPAEMARLARLGVRVFGMDEIHRRGIAAVLCDALSIARSGTAGFGLSLDLDGLDPVAVPGVSCAEPHGIDPQELADALCALRDCPDLVALEIAEYAPAKDREHLTAEWIARLAAAALGPNTARLQDEEMRFGAHNYAPLPVVFTRGEGVWLWDVAGRRYLDLMSAYSAVSFGHSNPRLLRALTGQAGRLALTSRAYSNDRLPRFLEALCSYFGFEAALPVNTGLEAVETALKAARKWAYQVKGVAPGRAEIIACEGNFHGRSIAIVGMSSEEQYRDGFGPFPPGFKRIAYGSTAALEEAITPDTAAFLVEPIQGEGGIIVPPEGWLKRCAEVCRHHNVLLIADEVQTGLGRTGKPLACDHDGVRPDGLILGKALGGGLLPVSAFLADRSVMDVFTPGDHGSTFGGNPLAAAVGLEALELFFGERLWERAAELGDRLLAQLRRIDAPCVRAVRGRGLLVGVDLDPEMVSAEDMALALLARGLLSKDTHGTVIRIAPPLTIDAATLDHAVEVLAEALHSVRPKRRQHA
jgi:ornithine--oxo-acid transaminase